MQIINKKKNLEKPLKGFVRTPPISVKHQNHNRFRYFELIRSIFSCGRNAIDSWKYKVASEAPFLHLQHSSFHFVFFKRIDEARVPFYQSF